MAIVTKDNIDQLEAQMKDEQGDDYNPEVITVVKDILDDGGKDPFADFFGLELVDYARTIYNRYKETPDILAKKVFGFFRSIVPEGREVPEDLKGGPAHNAMIMALKGTKEAVGGYMPAHVAMATAISFLQGMDNMDESGAKAPPKMSFARFTIFSCIGLLEPDDNNEQMDKDQVKMLALAITTACTASICDDIDAMDYETRANTPMDKKTELMLEGINRVKKQLFVNGLGLGKDERPDENKGEDTGNPDT